MDPGRLIRRSDYAWELPRHGAMRVPGIIFADEALIRGMDDKVYEQVGNVATLPGIVNGLLRDAGRALGLRFPDRRRRGVRPRRRGRRLGGWRRLRHLVRCAHAAHGRDARANWRRSRRRWRKRCTTPFRPAWAASARCASTPPKWTRCSRAAHAGRSSAVTAPREDLDRIEEHGAWRARSRRGVRSRPSAGSATRWARSARAITISKCSTWPRSSTALRLMRSGSQRATS